MDKPATPFAFVSPEYRARSLDWAVRVSDPGTRATEIIRSARAFYEYVYGPDKVAE